MLRRATPSAPPRRNFLSLSLNLWCKPFPRLFMSPLFIKISKDFATIWTTIDPIGNVAIFAGLTASLTRAERRRTALRATLYATVILVVAVVAGQFILDAIGIHLHSLKVAGGIILFLFGLQMLFGRMDAKAAAEAPEPGRDLAVFPLAVPSIAGPGAMMAVILLTDNDVYTVAEQAQTGVVLLVVLLLTYILLLFSDAILRIIGRQGAAILVRVMGIILCSLAVEHVFGPPKDHDAAIAVLREVVRLGINHIDTSDFYGPRITNQLIKEALHPYPEQLRIVTKVGARRDAEGNWPRALAPDELRQAIHDNLANLGLNTLDVVNLRVGGIEAPEPGSIAEPFSVLAEMQQQRMIKHLGVSTVTAEQIAEAQSIAPVVCVQNFYNIANRQDDSLIDSLAQQGIAYVPYFPLGGFSPLQSDTLSSVAARLGATSMAVALAWLLQRSPNILLIPGTSSVEHLRENVAGAGLQLPDDSIKELDEIAG